MFSLSRRTFQHNIVYAWDKEGQSNIVEITKKGVDANHLKGLNMDIFLSKFEAWKDADSEGKQSLFAALREMHQAVGINKASTVFGADEEMLAFGNYVSKVKELEQKTQREIEKAKPENSQVIRPSESLDPRSQSVVQDIPRVVPKKRRIRRRLKGKQEGVEKKLIDLPKLQNAKEEKLDFSKENKKIKEIIENVKKPSYVSKINDNEKQFLGTSVVNIDYAVVKQGVHEFYIYDKPVNDERTVYRTDMNKNVIGVVTVDRDDNIINHRGNTFNTPFEPIN